MIRFLTMGHSRRALAVEALLVVLTTRLLVFSRGQHVALQKVGRLSREPMKHTFAVPAHVSEAVRDITWALKVVRRSVGRRHRCLVLAISAARMLSRRGAPWAIHVGIDQTTDGLLAHAWLTTGSRVVMGGRMRRTFTPLVTYRCPDR